MIDKKTRDEIEQCRLFNESAKEYSGELTLFVNRFIYECESRGMRGVALLVTAKELIKKIETSAERENGN